MGRGAWGRVCKTLLISKREHLLQYVDTIGDAKCGQSNSSSGNVFVLFSSDYSLVGPLNSLLGIFSL